MLCVRQTARILTKYLEFRCKLSCHDDFSRKRPHIIQVVTNVINEQKLSNLFYSNLQQNKHAKRFRTQTVTHTPQLQPPPRLHTQTPILSRAHVAFIHSCRNPFHASVFGGRNAKVIISFIFHYFYLKFLLCYSYLSIGCRFSLLNA